MGRRPRRDDDSPIEQFFVAAFHIFRDAPIWLGPVISLVVFLVFRFVVPVFFASPAKGTIDTGMIFRPILPYIAWFLGGGLLVVWLAAEGHKLLNRSRFDKQTGADSIRNLTWGEFEHLVAEAYRRRGYAARVVGNPDGDGGVDVELTRPGETVLIQCKHWKAWSVGVQVVRELLGVVVHRRVTRGVIVTSGRFSEEARRFAYGNSQIELVDGAGLVAMIEEVRRGERTSTPAVKLSFASTSQSPSTPHPTARLPVSPTCPVCGTGMVMRVAKKGQNAGSQFWGCPKYPACRGIRQIAPGIV